MPVLTQAQSHAVGLLRKLTYARHDQLHWLISRTYPNVTPEKIMRQLGYMGKAVNDGQHYFWPGCEIKPELIAAVDIMLCICGGSLPIFDVGRHPCALIFFLLQANRTQPFLLYTPKEGAETQCKTIAETQREPQDHAVVFYIQNQAQIPLLKISRPYIFAVDNGKGGYDFVNANM